MTNNRPDGGQQNWLQKALSLHKANQFGPAKDIFLKILKSDPRNPYLLYLLGETCSQLGDFTESLVWLDKAVNISPDQPGTH